MNLTKGLITSIIDNEAFNEAQRAGITKYFLDEDYIPVFNYVSKFYAEHKTTPSRDAVRYAFPNFEFAEHAEPLNFYLNELKESYRRSILETELEKAVNTYNKDSKEAEGILRNALTSLHVTSRSHKDVDASGTALDAIEEYQKRKENPGATGILSGWPKMDYQTLGFQPEEFCVGVGEKYMGKSWLLIWLAYKAALQGERVLFATKEMSAEQVMRRFRSIYAGVTFDKLRRGELNDKQEQQFKQKMGHLAESTTSFTVARAGVSNLQDLEIKGVEMDASIIFTDSVYLFDPEQNYRVQNKVQKLGDVSNRCKEIATNLGIPFVATVQAGRKKSKERIPTLDDIEWSNQFSQDADTCFFLERTDIDKELSRAQLYLLKSRDGNEDQFYIDTDFKGMKFNQNNDVMEPKVNVFEENDDIFSQ